LLTVVHILQAHYKLNHNIYSPAIFVGMLSLSWLVYVVRKRANSCLDLFVVIFAVYAEADGIRQVYGCIWGLLALPPQKG
jgi:hypothetical protein